jgi:hypothetical protein
MTGIETLLKMRLSFPSFYCKSNEWGQNRQRFLSSFLGRIMEKPTCYPLPAHLVRLAINFMIDHASNRERLRLRSPANACEV